MDKRPLSDLISLKGKKALITGAAAGLGKAMACRFAEAGADLILVDIEKKELESAVEELSEFDIDIENYFVDLSRKKEIDALWEELGNITPDILINNAGIYPFKEFTKVEESFYKKVMDVNLNSVYWMCQQMIKRRIKKGGTIINVGSIEAFLPFKKDLVHYSASKAAVISLTRALANEHGRDGFKINALIPGGIVTSGTKKLALKIFKFEKGLISSAIDFKRRLALGRLGDPDEVALMALVLASDFSSYMQGALVAVDGGFLST